MPRKKSAADKPLSIGQARGKIAKAMSDLAAGNNPGPISFRLKQGKKAGETYPLKLTQQQRESLVHCTNLRRSLKQKIEQAGEGTQVVGVTRKELDELHDETGQAAYYALSPHKKRLVAVLTKVAKFFDEELKALFAREGPNCGKPRPAKSVVKPCVYTLDVFLIGGRIPAKFAEKKRAVSRTIQIRGDQTLENLHHAIFDAFDRYDEHMYEFQFGKKPMDQMGPRYVLKGAFGDGDDSVAGRVDQTTIESLGLKIGRSFGYWFDFGDDWWHQINVEAVQETILQGHFPRVTKRVGKSPPQYLEEEC